MASKSEGENGISQDSQEEESRDFLKRILQELQEREIRLVAIEQEISKLEFKLFGANDGRGRKASSTVQLLSSEAYRELLRRELQVQREQRQEALDQIEKAKERKEMIEQELQISVQDKKMGNEQ